ncbi:MAG TPA: NAD(P)-binding domain-containing protein, partial [Chloroflexota bacterium]|nr:NAD(P)-binding domain-containing protein [Chloroflexota bacterium]
EPERVQTIVIGGGQAGLSVGYHLAQRGLPFVILDAHARIGDAWRQRWDSLRLFSPARFNGLAGMPFPAPAHSFPTKDEMADYLEAYAARFELPVRTGVRVDRLSKRGERFEVAAGERRFEAENVVVAMASYQRPRVPAFAGELGPGVVQLHSSAYRNPTQLRDGGALVVGAGNSGAEVALDLAPGRPTWLSGRDTGHLPFRVEGAVGRVVIRPLFRIVFHRLLTVDTPLGRKVRPKLISHAMPLIRIKPKDLSAAGIERVPRMVGVRGGLPLLEDGRVLDVANVIWCTGYQPGFSWIDLPVLGEHEPLHERGIVAGAPGLYFVGLAFLYAASSSQIHGVERDAGRIVETIAARSRATRPAAVRQLALRPAA